MDAKLYGLLVETARHRKTIAYSATGRSRAVIGVMLDEINRHEALELRPLLSVVVVHKDTLDPGAMFFACATDLKRYGGDPRKAAKAAFVEREREAVWKTWAG